MADCQLRIAVVGASTVFPYLTKPLNRTIARYKSLICSLPSASLNDCAISGKVHRPLSGA